MDPDRMSSLLHDLKSPLLAIKHLSNTLRDRESLSDDARRKVELIYESAQEAAEYLKVLRDSPAELEEEHAAVEIVDVAELAQEVVEQFRAQAAAKEQELQFDPPSSEEDEVDARVRAEPFQLRRAMNNLLSNALKFSPLAGTIQVQVRCENDTVQFSVADEGPGLSEEEQENIFHPFHQADPDPTGEEDSTGVGLYIVKQIVERHGGQVDLESSKGDGSTFTLVLPAAKSSESLSGYSSADCSSVQFPSKTMNFVSSTPSYRFHE